MGWGHARMALTRSPVMRVKRSKAVAVASLAHRDEWADDLVHIAARAEITAGAGMTRARMSFSVVQRAEGRREFGVGLEGERVLALGPVQGDGRDATLDLPGEVLWADHRVPAFLLRSRSSCFFPVRYCRGHHCPA